jgi:hypothetical protein
MKQQTLLYIITFGIILIFFILRAFLIVDFRFAKEEFLIIRNYSKNTEAFQNAKPFLFDLPHVDINFINKFDLEIDLSQRDELIYKPDMFYEDVFTMFVSDTSTNYYYKQTGDEIINFWLVENKIKIQTIDSTFLIPKYFTINYRGTLSSDNSQKALEVFGLDFETLNEIRDELRKLNCFGYSRDYNGNIVIHFRTNFSYMFDVFSYLLLLPENIEQEISHFNSKYGKIDNDIFWFHFEYLHLSYLPYMKLSNRTI